MKNEEEMLLPFLVDSSGLGSRREWKGREACVCAVYAMKEELL